MIPRLRTLSPPTFDMLSLPLFWGSHVGYSDLHVLVNIVEIGTLTSDLHVIVDYL